MKDNKHIAYHRSMMLGGAKVCRYLGGPKQCRCCEATVGLLHTASTSSAGSWDVNEDNEDVNEGGEGGFLEGRAHSSPLEHRLALTRLLHVLANPAAGRWTQIDAGSCNNVKYEPR